MHAYAGRHGLLPGHLRSSGSSLFPFNLPLRSYSLHLPSLLSSAEAICQMHHLFPRGDRHPGRRSIQQSILYECDTIRPAPNTPYRISGNTIRVPAKRTTFTARASDHAGDLQLTRTGNALGEPFV